MSAPDPLLRITLLYHFTDQRNLPLIQHLGGLYAMTELKRRGIQVPAPGGNQWSRDADSMSGMDRYVHLCFRNSNAPFREARFSREAALIPIFMMSMLGPPSAIFAFVSLASWSAFNSTASASRSSLRLRSTIGFTSTRFFRTETGLLACIVTRGLRTSSSIRASL